jgi:hypothetical protein
MVVYQIKYYAYSVRSPSRRIFIFLVFLLGLVPPAANAEMQLMYKDGSVVCGSYVETAKGYCKQLYGGELCIEKSPALVAKVVDVCDESDMTGKSTEYLKQRNLSEIDWLVKGGAQTGAEKYPAPAKKSKAKQTYE